MMDFFSSIFSSRPHGHWVWAGIQQQLHTRTLPQVGCSICEAEGWIPASKPPMATCQQSPDAESAPDDTPAYLAMAAEEVACAIRHLELACADSRVDASVRRAALDALRDALTAIEAELEASNAED